MTATARPIALEVRPDGIPAVLKARPQWVLWDYQLRDGKWTKMPICIATDGPAESDNPDTWGSFEAAVKGYRGRGYAGIGFMFSPDDPFCGIDIDKCRNPQSGELTTLARTILAELDGHNDISPSSTGVKVIVRASLPDGKGRRSIKHGIEMYDRRRFFTLTGHLLEEGGWR